MIAYDVCGVQPMTGPTGLIFAMHSKYTAQAAGNTNEALFDEADTDFSGTGTHDAITDADDTNPFDGTLANWTTGAGNTTADGEALGDATPNLIPEMAFTIEKTSVIAKTRALRAEKPFTVWMLKQNWQIFFLLRFCLRLTVK